MCKVDRLWNHPPRGWADAALSDAPGWAQGIVASFTLQEKYHIVMCAIEEVLKHTRRMKEGKRWTFNDGRFCVANAALSHIVSETRTLASQASAAWHHSTSRALQATSSIRVRTATDSERAVLAARGKCALCGRNCDCMSYVMDVVGPCNVPFAWHSSTRSAHTDIFDVCVNAIAYVRRYECTLARLERISNAEEEEDARTTGDEENAMRRRGSLDRDDRGSPCVGATCLRKLVTSWRLQRDFDDVVFDFVIFHYHRNSDELSPPAAEWAEQLSNAQTEMAHSYTASVRDHREPPPVVNIDRGFWEQVDGARAALRVDATQLAQRWDDTVKAFEEEAFAGPLPPELYSCDDSEWPTVEPENETAPAAPTPRTLRSRKVLDDADDSGDSDDSDDSDDRDGRDDWDGMLRTYSEWQKACATLKASYQNQAAKWRSQALTRRLPRAESGEESDDNDNEQDEDESDEDCRGRHGEGKAAVEAESDDSDEDEAPVRRKRPRADATETTQEVDVAPVRNSPSRSECERLQAVSLLSRVYARLAAAGEMKHAARVHSAIESCHAVPPRYWRTGSL